MIPIFKPHYNTKEILSELEKIFTSGWTGLGPKTAEFEERTAEFLDVDYSVFVNSCTAALLLSLHALNLPKPSKVIVPDITFVSTASIVTQLGHTPVLVPVNNHDLCIDLDYVLSLLKTDPTIKAIIPVHYSGNMCDMDQLISLSNKYNIAIIEDCAHAFGSRYKQKAAGTIGDFGCFSFHSVKNLAISDGGIVVCNNKESYEKLKKYRWFGIDRSTYDRMDKQSYSFDYNIRDIGFKSHGNDVMAVIGLANLKNIDFCNQRRSEIYHYYLENLPFNIHQTNNHTQSSHHLVSCMIPNGKRNKFIDFMKTQDISIGVHYKPLSSFSVFSDFATDETKLSSEKIYAEIATLPCFPELTDEALHKIVMTSKQFLDTL